MQLIRTLEELALSAPCSMALGTFDGLHRGHAAVISRVTEGAGPEPAVFTFDRSPAGSPALCTPEDKLLLLEKQGIRRVVSVAFQAVRDMEAEAFVTEVLFAGCRARRLACGEDFRFGRRAAGDVSLLEQLCRAHGVDLTVVPPVLEAGEKISSTRIRRAVEAGDIPLANRLLGRPFGFSLTVIHGNHLGSGLGTPTINQAVPKELALPRFGVYAAWGLIGGSRYYGVTNIGVKPTVGSDRVLAETWFPEFSGDLYGQQIRLCLLEFVRPERKFASLEELKAEILRNAEQAKEICRRQTG